MPGEDLDPAPSPDEGPARSRFWERRGSVWVVAIGATLVAGLGVWLVSQPGPPPPVATTTSFLVTTVPPTATTRPLPTTTIGPSTTITTPPATIPVPTVASYDVVVVGDGLGGASAATAAARLGANVALLSPVGYIGGQASAAGVSTMDEGSNHSVLRRSGIYGELATFVQGLYGIGNVGECYFLDDPICPEPVVLDDFFRGLLSAAGVDLIPMTNLDSVLQTGNRVSGVVVDRSTYHAEVVIDATEFSDLYPLVDGLRYEVGSEAGCVQDTTWVAIRAWYPGVASPDTVPPQSAAQDLYDIHGSELDDWLHSFRSKVADIPGRTETGLADVPWDLETETHYRALADRRDFSAVNDVPEITRTGVNYANDYSISAAAIEDHEIRLAEFRKALHKTYAYLWYLRWELGVTDWGVDVTQSFGKAQRLLWDDLIPDTIEANLPPIPYLREGRRMITTEMLEADDLTNEVRGLHRFDDSVMLGGYFADFHGCLEPEAGLGYGLFEIPIGVFIPETVDGFMPGMSRSAGVSRTAASAVRTQPEEIWSGQAIGIIAGLAAQENIAVRDVPAARVQEILLANRLIFFLPR